MSDVIDNTIFRCFIRSIWLKSDLYLGSDNSPLLFPITEAFFYLIFFKIVYLRWLKQYYDLYTTWIVN